MTNQDPKTLRCHYLLLVTTPEEEKQLNISIEELNLSVKQRKGRYATYNFIEGSLSNNLIAFVRLRAMGPFIYNGASTRGLLCQQETSANSVILLGMAFGIDQEKQQFGDVLVSTSIVPYDLRTVVSNETGGYNFCYEKQRRFSANQKLVEFLKKNKTKEEYEIMFGAFLSGGSLIKSSSFRDELVAMIPASDEPIIGGEMEGVALLSISSPDSPIWIIVKGVSDFADEHRDKYIDEMRPKACKNAASFVMKSLQKLDH